MRNVTRSETNARGNETEEETWAKDRNRMRLRGGIEK